jgi:endonuclease YncB( thermonuclease family)
VVLIAALLTALVVFGPGPSVAREANRAVGETFAGRVTQVVDGDTFRMRNASVRIRIWGLDAEETGTAQGARATQALQRLIEGRTPTCLVRDIDRFGRIVGQCALPDGRDIAAVMIATGAAMEFCRYSRNHYGSC